jgi:hypothetical protein
MPATRRQRMRSVKTMRAGATNASSGYGKFIKNNLKMLDKGMDELMPMFSGTNPDYIKKSGCGPAQKKITKIFEDLDKVEQMLKSNKYYDRNNS